MEFVRVPDGSAQRRAVTRSGRSPLFDQRPQRWLVDDREDDVANDAVGMREGGIGDVKEEALLTADSFEILKQLVLDASLGAGVNGLAATLRTNRRCPYRPQYRRRAFCTAVRQLEFARRISYKPSHSTGV